MPYALTEDGISVHYDVRGTGDPLLLIAGQSNSRHWWDWVRPYFAESFTTIAFDHRGTGASDKPEGDYSTVMFAEDARAVLDDLGVGRAHVYGTSMGGRAAQWLAALHPSRVERLVLGCTSPGGPHGFERGPEVRKALAQPDRGKALQALIDLMYTPGWNGPYSTVGDPDMPPYARRAHLLASAAHNGWDALAAIKAPTLVVHGSDDEFNPTANAPLIADRVPDSRLHLIEGARHAYFEEFHGEAGPLVADFLTA
ncbi:alpha/beta fold hydrolase [Saccharothrix violaceirubra]|uniref:Pimeloyl-ACP methyl ester carboxylesterase n=1 Tax=Saccharothrix violaceirubra TaxID=413306 RepID=A0A7W7T622_9PSEU|nr:alpha/beta fold hydrolase [Saccharothrix violaceirubra]MBB4967239.1 pimeloyl-ACP methyl ester carboxylesterase [Saccharothrix violaceirubra]